MEDSYTPTRPVMGRSELIAHRARTYGRDYVVSCDGYDDMELAQSQGWKTHASWGRDGWDLGQWPYVTIHLRTTGGRYEVLTITEGDHEVYAFTSEADQHAAVDYLFLWYAAYQEWCPVRGEQGREALDSGAVDVDAKYRGPSSATRLAIAIAGDVGASERVAPFTPLVKGPVPPNVRRWRSGPPFGRLHLDPVEAPTHSGQIVLDRFSGERFRVQLDVDCGLGCRCAAEAEWVQRDDD